MKYWISYFIKHCASHPLILTFIITFLESLAIIGLTLPGLVLMTPIGTLIGHGKLSFYSAWIVSIIGCSLGDYLSYYIGWKFNKIIHKIQIFKKNINLFNRIKNTLNNYSMVTILFGKFFGPTRPLIPMMGGMLKIPIKKFFLPSLLGCIIWPVLYFTPGILTGFIINHPKYYTKKIFSIWILIPTLCTIIIIMYFIWILIKKKITHKIHNLPI